MIKHGFVTARKSRVGFLEHVEAYFAQHAQSINAPDSTKAVWNRAIRMAWQFWKKDVPLQALSGKDFVEFRVFLLSLKGRYGQRWSEQTANKCCGVLSQALNAAVVEGLIDRNPLRGWVKTTAGANPANWEYIDLDTIREVMAASTCSEERLLLGLSRFAGLRIPSEIKSLTWDDLEIAPDGKVGLLKVRTPKTQRSGKHEKVVPVCEELLELLKEARLTSNSEFMLPRMRTYSSPQMVVIRLCRRAGVEVWRRITHNLRASCLSDWRKRFSDIEAAQWAGNSPQVLLAHYTRSDKSPTSIFAAAQRMSGSEGQPDSRVGSDGPVTATLSPRAA